MDRYNNYHKHDDVSNLMVMDSNVKVQAYLDRCAELNEINYFTTNHGSGGDVLDSLSKCQKAGINCKYGMEGYITADSYEKVRGNYHIVLIPRTNIARKKLNKANSRASLEGYYYRPRLFLDDLLYNFSSDELYLTTACVGGILKTDESIDNIFYPLYEKYGPSMMLEIQCHEATIQKDLNDKIITLQNELHIPLIAGNDSHYIYPYQQKEQQCLLSGKKIDYGDQEFLLDYPDIDTLVKRFKKQGQFTDEQITSAINQTLIFDDCENININKEVKMPTIYGDLTEDQKIIELKKIITEKFPKVMKADNIPKSEYPKYIKNINEEMDVIEKTKEIHTVDYFLFNNRMTELAVNKYGGILTRSGRGSAPAFLINKILGITQIDRLATTLPMYPQRFMSVARLLENKAMPDIDFNIVDQKPFVEATRELLGEDRCYPMIKYGTLKESESFRNVCRSHDLVFSEYSNVSKNINNFKKDKKWKPYIDEAESYMNTIIGGSVHPCAFVLSNKDIEEEIGVIKIGDNICALINSDSADEFKYLKNDYLIVSVWDIISKTFDLIGQPILRMTELLPKITDEIWDMFAEGLTATLNQVGGDWATSLLKQYKPKNIEELSQFVACIRPSFNSLRDKFINREPYTTGSKELDKVLGATNGMVLFQENLMQYFEWLGVDPANSVGLIKKISKKKIKPADFEKLEKDIKEKWTENTGSEEGFDENWKDMQSMMSYGFNSPHGYATALDCLYGAYLKYTYPLQYYTVVLDKYVSNKDKTNELLLELDHFGIHLYDFEFGRSKSTYAFDLDTNSIYKSTTSIKGISKSDGDELYCLKDNHYDSFIDLLTDIKEKTSVGPSHLDIFIKVGFFKKYGDVNELSFITEMFSKYKDAKVLNKKKLTEHETLCLAGFYEKETKCQYKELDNMGFIENLIKYTDIPQSTIAERMDYQNKYLGTISLVIPTISDKYYYVTKMKPSFNNVFVSLYRLKDGNVFTYKIKGNFKFNPFEENDIIAIDEIRKNYRMRKTGVDSNNKPTFERTDELEEILSKWHIVAE